MALPADNCAAAVNDDVACTSTWLIGERIRTIGMQGICSCDCETPFRSYTTIGATIQDPLGDSLIITMLDLGPVNLSASGALKVASTHLARYRLELRENGWPTITAEDGAVLAPDSNLINTMSKHSQGHGEALYRRMTNAIQMRTLFASSTHPHIVSESIRLSAMNPLGPQTRQVGWGVQVDVPLRLT